MTLSRTARILIAMLMLAAAVFVWVNFFTGEPAPTDGVTAESEEQADPAEGDPAQGEDAEGEDAADPAEPDPAAADQAAADPAESDQADAEGGAQGPDPLPSVAVPADEEGDDDAPTVVAPSDGNVVGRDVVVAEFPFLITEPPATQEADAAAADGEAGAARPGGARASVNPFSPILVQAPPEPEPEASPGVQEVQVPEAPEVEAVQETAAEPAAPPQAPAPRAAAPSSPRPTGLPRALPGGTLPIAPEPLRSARAERNRIAPENLAGRAAVREPDEDAPRVRPQPVGGADEADPDAEANPLAPGDVPAAAQPDDPLVAGSNPLSRYLRDRNVSFTGSVVGSVSVGVFRTADRNAPVVVTLGGTLPDSDIVLTDLRGQEAEFTLGDTSQVLNLDLRR